MSRKPSPAQPSPAQRRRKPVARHFELIEALEGRSLASESLGVLTAGIGVSSALVARAKETAPQVARLASRSPSLADTVPTRPGGSLSASFSRIAAFSPNSTVLVAQATDGQPSLDFAPAANSITVHWLSPAASSSEGAGGGAGTSHGGSGATSPASSGGGNAMAGSAAAPTSSVILPASTVPPANPTPSGAQGAGAIIRPMSLAPLSDGASKHIKPADGSGNPPPPANLAPAVSFSGGTLVQQPGGTLGNQTYTVQMANNAQGQPITTVPAGFVTSIQATVPNGYASYVINSYAWGGGSSYAGYFSTAADQAAPQTMSISAPVKNQSTYSFIVPPKQQNFSVTINVTYTNGASGQDTIKFGSEGPSGSLSVVTAGQPTTSPNLPGTILFFNQDAGEGQTMQPTSTASTNYDYTFMVIQTVNTTRSYTPAGGQPVVVSTGNNAYIDNGLNNKPIGMDTKNANSWSVKAGTTNNSTDNIVQDTVYVSPNDINTDTNLQVGTPANGNNAAVPETFNTYLMAVPNVPGSVWVAVAKLNWGWGGQLTSPGNGVWTLNPNIPTPPQTPTNPIPNTASDYFPTWQGQSSSLKW